MVMQFGFGRRAKIGTGLGPGKIGRVVTERMSDGELESLSVLETTRK